ncbi:hypothetical protein ACO1O0_003023 [Amphichorda felina]
MPIFQDDLDLDHHLVDPDPESPPIDHPLPPTLRRLSEESLRTELCEGPHTPDQKTDNDTTSSREELIERLKRGESPTWVPARHLESVFNHGSSPPQRPKPSRPSSGSSNLLPPAQITPEKNGPAASPGSRLQDGLTLERPRSALHTGDFTNDDEEHRKPDAQLDGQRIEHPQRTGNLWMATSPPRDFTPFQFDHHRDFLRQSQLSRSFGTSPLSLSPSVSSSFAYQPPTSPLVQSESNEELEISGALDSMAFPSSGDGRISPQSGDLMRSRRPSFSSESSPIQQHASMVGSYEESILRGRMSTTPSRPLEFLAQIGVLGMGKCKSSLRCPPHVTLPFPAVYYSYSSIQHGRSRTDDGPSPYVGQVDLENGLPNQVDDSRSKRKAHSRYADRKSTDGDVDTAMGSQDSDKETKRVPRAKRSSTSPRAPPGGSYRIPEKGQLQIIIKNQNKTAVKLFLVPYDLAGMEPGTKTFIRQRCYSAGPIIDSVPTVSELGSTDRPTLRYLVHLHICSPARGRYYLYKSIRVVFANRVPDGKEKLRNETTWPDPRFTPYKAIRVMHPPLSTTSGPGATLAADKAFRRRSSGFSLAPSAQAFDIMDGMHSNISSTAATSGIGNGDTQPLDPIPLRLPPRKRVASEVSDTTNTTAAELRSPESSQASRPSTKDSSRPWDATRYAKLTKGDLGYGGYAYSQSLPGSPGVEGLLSQRLRSLGAKSPTNGESPQGSE